MAPPDVIDVASRPVRAAERTPTLRRKKSFPKVKVNSSRMDFTAFILKGKRKPRTSTSLMTTKKIFPNSGPPFVKIIDQKVGFVGSLISTPPVLVRPGPWSSVSGLPADKISEIDQPAGLVWLFFSIEKESAVCASHLLLGSAGRHGIFVQIYIGRPYL
ncbi:hypothetical protein KY290_006377 [Solanum tuberosum]|uniref:Uncharacterized protein n=1 Tax=Solanum tuberosum TaxID=4113 RepID=A0ABQ7USL7_SOLTU|nr:hypothetical protein KY285_031665 [Solanum tuberosum]KAH0660156.1 hypothetical protein KY289_028904 [Solanum tuberosum]KAH0663723.1 hypothetical protein KY284_028654 [Solanum tuberosum]KAH0671409.1 hypothetical protein KY289_025902 [Solanum tuberosum]KAH0676535.1 hypothetical protein KY285_024336 [Solanum tuberosum]